MKAACSFSSSLGGGVARDGSVPLRIARRPLCAESRARLRKPASPATRSSTFFRNGRLIRSFEDHFGDASIVGAIGGANYQKVLSGGEAREIEGKLFALRIDHAGRRFHGHP